MRKMSLSSGVDTVANVYTFAEACRIWEFSESTLRNRCNRKGFEKIGLKENRDYRKAGSVGLITDMAMRKMYGPPPTELLKNKIDMYINDLLTQKSSIDDLNSVQEEILRFLTTDLYKTINKKYPNDIEEFIKYFMDGYIKAATK